MDNIEIIIQIIFVLAFVAGPKLLKMLASLGAQKSVQKVKTQKASRAHLSAFVSKSSTVSSSEYSGSNLSLVQQQGQRQSSGQGQVDNLEKRLLIAKNNIEKLEAHIKTKEYNALVSVLQSHCMVPLNAFDARLQLKNPVDVMIASGIAKMNAEIDRIERITLSIEKIVKFRSSDRRVSIFTGLDFAAQDSMMPFVANAHRSKLASGGTMEAVVPKNNSADFLNIGFSDIGFVKIDDDIFESVGRFAQLPFYCAESIWKNTNGLAKRVTKEIGLPDSVNSMAYFYSTGRLNLEGLISSWMPWIFADICATLQLGSAYAYAMDNTKTEKSISANGLQFTVGERALVLDMPFYLRLRLICEVLSAMGHEQSSEKWLKKWSFEFGQPENVILETAVFSPIQLSVSDIFSSLSNTIEKLLRRSLSSFGGYSLASIPYLLSDSNTLAEMEKIAQQLSSGQGTDCSPRIAIGAAAIAANKHSTYAAKIRRSVLHILLGNAKAATPELPSENTSLENLSDCLNMEGFIPQAIIATSAFSKNRGGRFLT